MSVQPDDLGFRVFLRERKAPHVGGLPNVFFCLLFLGVLPMDSP